MNYFLDTNVELGFVFCTDPWNEESVAVFNKEDMLYYSNSVDDEFYKLYNQFLNQQKFFFRELKRILALEKSTKQINCDTLKLKSWQLQLHHDFEQNKKDKCIEVFWKFCKRISKSEGSLDEIHFKIRDIIHNISRFLQVFERVIFNRKLEFENKVIYYDERTHDYKDIFDKLVSVGVHNPDTFIILDAHDLALEDGIVLEFVTADNIMIQNVNQISNYLSIHEFHYLKNFKPCRINS